MIAVKIVVIVMLVSLTFSAGLQINRAHLLAVLKEYRLLGRALLANFIVVPVLGVLAVRLFHVNEYVATGILLMAIAPGVPFVILSGGRKKGGSLGFAASLAFLLPAISIVTLPITARLVLPSNEQAHVPVMNVLVSLLLFQLLPLVLGAVVAERSPAAAVKLTRPVDLVFLASVLVLFGILGPRLIRDIGSVFGSNGILATLLIVVLSVATGWLLGGPQEEYRRTLGIGTALRNVGLAVLVATQSFPGTQAPAAVLTYLVVQLVVVALVGAFFTRTARPAVPASA